MIEAITGKKASQRPAARAKKNSLIEALNPNWK